MIDFIEIQSALGSGGKREGTGAAKLEDSQRRAFRDKRVDGFGAAGDIHYQAAVFESQDFSAVPVYQGCDVCVGRSVCFYFYQ
ncbi:hypothetical protein SDC9_204287 [bioreactor metagenome]|uniref:Uncharacterized protein n=1 Tax=bioreactor metagenome TaxID=1076179 RepID=A0A645IZK6_9ZZZZ